MTEETVYKAQAKAAMNRSLTRPAALLVIGGAILLIATLSGMPMLEIFAPVLFIGGFGALLMLPAYRATAEKPSQVGFLAVPGAFFLAIGTLISTLIAFDHPEAMAYAWTVIPVSVMAGLMYWKRFDAESGVHAFGQKFIRVFFYLFLGFGLFFELLVFETLGPWWPLLLVAAGVYLFWQDRRQAK